MPYTKPILEYIPSHTHITLRCIIQIKLSRQRGKKSRGLADLPMTRAQGLSPHLLTQNNIDTRSLNILSPM